MSSSIRATQINDNTVRSNNSLILDCIVPFVAAIEDLLIASRSTNVDTGTIDKAKAVWKRGTLGGCGIGKGTEELWSKTHMVEQKKVLPVLIDGFDNLVEEL